MCGNRFRLGVAERGFGDAVRGHALKHSNHPGRLWKDPQQRIKRLCAFGAGAPAKNMYP
jgi:hypothetical protein